MGEMGGGRVRGRLREEGRCEGDEKMGGERG